MAIAAKRVKNLLHLTIYKTSAKHTQESKKRAAHTHDTQQTKTTQKSYYSKSSLISSFTVSCPGLNAGFPKWGHDAHL